VISRRSQRLVYTREVVDVNVWQVEVPSLQGKPRSPTKLISSTRFDGYAQFSPDGKRIAFSSGQTGSFEIWISSSDGSNAYQLTSRGGYCGAPHWSPDGERIVFESAERAQWGIYVVNAKGGKPKRLTNGPTTDMAPSWSQDGSWIYFGSDRS